MCGDPSSHSFVRSAFVSIIYEAYAQAVGRSRFRTCIQVVVLLNIAGFCEVRSSCGVRRDVVSATSTLQCIFMNVLVF